MKKRWRTGLLAVIFLMGAGLFLYPKISDRRNSERQSETILHYIENVSDAEAKDDEKLWKEAQEYNEGLCLEGNQWLMTEQERESYEQCLNVDGTGLMAYIEIPAIGCRLPIYHGTTEAVLQTGAGHVEGSSLPVGGEGTHCVLSGHRGLPSAKLFTDLDQLEIGDTFLIHTLDEVLTYEVDKISIVEPTDFSELQIVEGKDYCTLVTCTPYGINTHRLLIRGSRV